MGEDFNLGSSVFDLLRKKLELDAQTEATRQETLRWTQQSASYGVDEQGRLYYRGVPSTTGVMTGISPLVLIGAGILAVTLAVFLLKD